MRRLALLVLVVLLIVMSLATGCGRATATPALPAVWLEGCEIAVATGASAAPATPWRSCGQGCLELAHDWGDPARRFFGAIGAPGTLAYTRDTGAAHETQIVGLPENAVLFSGRDPTRFRGCSLAVRSLDAERAAIEFTDGERKRRAVWSIPLRGRGTPLRVHQGPAGQPPLEAVLTAELYATTTSRKTVDVSQDGAPAARWASPHGTLAAHLAGRGRELFFTAIAGDGAASILTWDARRQARQLARDAGALVTDGRDMVWFGDAAGPALYTAPFTTDPARLAPRRLRPARQPYIDIGAGVVGDGFALHNEDGELIVTRLSDAAAFTIPPRGSARWGAPLWIDGRELAVVEEAPAGAMAAGHIAYGHSWTIVRLDLSHVVSRAAGGR